MYIRFVVDIQDKRSGRRKGIFAGMGVLMKMDLLAQGEHDWYADIRKWFNERLPQPAVLSRSSKPHAKPVALSWFKDSSTEFIAKARAVANLMEKYDFKTTMLKTNRPGYIVYEDEYQIVAEPYAETTT